MNVRRYAGLIALSLLAACASPARGQGSARSNASSPPLPQLLSTDELAAWQKGGRSFTLIDVRSDVFTYLKGHLPGAEYLNTETLRATEKGVPAQILSARAYSDLFSRLGVSFDKPLVVYSAGETGNIDATFVAWLLAGFGHPKVFVLNGGYFKWELEHHPVVQKYPVVEATSFPTDPFDPERASLDDVSRAIAGGGAVLVDARPPSRTRAMPVRKFAAATFREQSVTTGRMISRRWASATSGRLPQSFVRRTQPRELHRTRRLLPTVTAQRKLATCTSRCDTCSAILTCVFTRAHGLSGPERLTCRSKWASRAGQLAAPSSSSLCRS